MAGLAVRNVSKIFNGKNVLTALNFNALSQKTTAILGPSGCGKSTLLRIIAGIESPDKGEIFWENELINDIPPHRRGFGLMFQDYALFPHLNVYKNIAFGLQFKNKHGKNIEERVDVLLNLVNMVGFENRNVHTLSGGEAQRVALARTLAPQPRLLMLDEPMGSLDKTLRDRLIVELRSILRQVQITTLYVTHDQEEAFSLADQVILIRDGYIEQIGTPEEIFQSPANTFVARFLGLQNIIAAEGRGDTAESIIGTLPLTKPAFGSINLLIRPDSVNVNTIGSFTVQGTVVEKVFLGSICRALINIKGVYLRFDFPPRTCVPDEGTGISISFYPEEALQIIPD